MRRIGIILFFIFSTHTIFAQCEALNSMDIISPTLSLPMVIKGFASMNAIEKWEFVQEDSVQYIIGRCKWDKVGCYPYKNFLLASKQNSKFFRYECYDKLVFDKLKEALIKLSSQVNKDGHIYYDYMGIMFVNFIESDLPENQCGITKRYMIELLNK